MDLTFTAEEEAFRKSVRAGLARNVPKKRRDERPMEWDDPKRIALAKDWQRKVYAARAGGPGGSGECSRRARARSYNGVGSSWTTRRRA
jgi:hypothetical protein